MKPIIDWLTATFETVEVSYLLKGLQLVTGCQVSAVDLPHGGNGFTQGLEIRCFSPDFEMVRLARVFHGGVNQNGRMMLDISGKSCGVIDDWPAMRIWLETLPAVRLTRVDLAVDLHEGEFTVDDAVEWHAMDLFTTGGRTPKTRTDGDWLYRKEGRTLYVGVAKNGKQLRAYEKGKQLGDLESAWTRFEVQFGNRDRVLPLDILTDTEKYFVGAYPALERIVQAAAERIKTISKSGFITISAALTNIKRSYGKWLHLLRAGGIEDTDLVESLSVRALPGRVQSSAPVAGVLSDTTKRSFDDWRTNVSRN